MLRVVHKLRISTAHTHYAGELAPASLCLSLFGDVATELCIVHDGDEGLFRAYQNVQFLAPVHAGDFLEVTGELVSVGKTSRSMRFTARKLIALCRREGLAVSAAELLAEPVVVCTAEGTCVVPHALQRGTQA
jgi:acyl-coenzyme A thioesterase PaaI-like protein